MRASLFFSSPERKDKVSFSDCLFSIHLYICLLTFHIFNFSRITRPISTKLGIRHPWVKGIQVASNEEPCPFQRGDNNEIANIHRINLKIFFRTTWLISTKLSTRYPRMKGIQFFFQNKDHSILKKRDTINIIV